MWDNISDIQSSLPIPEETGDILTAEEESDEFALKSCELLPSSIGWTLYKLSIGLRDKSKLYCFISRAFVQDIVLCNQCTSISHIGGIIIPTKKTLELYTHWMVTEPNTNSEIESSDFTETEDEEETEEQILMKQMGLPSQFSQKSKKPNIRKAVGDFFKMAENMGYVAGGNGKNSLQFKEVVQFKVEPKANRAHPTPRFRYIKRSKKEGDDNYEESSADEASLSPSIHENKVPADRGVDFSFDPIQDQDLIATNSGKKIKNDVEMKKYWNQRYRLFSKFDEGVLMDREGWFSVTPERLAAHIATRMVKSQSDVVLDGFMGVGGNAIQFALRGAYVYAIDMDPIKIRCARRNAEIYGVADRIQFIYGDFFKVAESILSSRHDDNGGFLGITSIFLSPPWGGPAYENQTFDIQNSMGGLDGIKIFRLAERICPNICYFLPRNTPTRQIIALASKSKKVEIEQSYLNAKVKAITAYYGELVEERISPIPDSDYRVM